MGAATALLAALTLTATPAVAATTPVAQVVPGTLALQGIACPSTILCVAVGSNIDINGKLQGVVVPIVYGAPGRIQAVPAAYELEGVACASNATCEAVGFSSGNQGVAVAITNGSAGAVRAVAGTSELIGIACPTISTCEAVGEVAIGSKSRGLVVAITNGTPGRVKVVPSTAALLGAACTTAASCEAVGFNGQPQGVAVAIASGSPGPVLVEPEPSELVGVACAGAGACMAVGRDFSGPTSYAMTAQIQGGVAGAPQQVASGTNVELVSVACRGATACRAVGADFSDFEGVTVVVTNGGPSAPVAVPGTSFLQGVACADAGTCQAVGVNNAGGGSLGVFVPMYQSNIVTVVVNGSQVYGSSSPTFTTTTRPPPGDTFGGQVNCTTVNKPPTPISPKLPSGSYPLNGVSCSGLTLNGSGASNFQIRYAGGTFTVPKAATSLVATPAGYIPRGLQARLSRAFDQTPLPGQTIVFRIRGVELCRATTDANGVGSCSLFAMNVGVNTTPIPGAIGARYAASYAGGPNYLPSEDSAPL